MKVFWVLSNFGLPFFQIKGEDIFCERGEWAKVGGNGQVGSPLEGGIHFVKFGWFSSSLNEEVGGGISLVGMEIFGFL